MKAVLIPIQPRWCEKIASGEKTFEARKTRPKIETPFPCYIYQTKGIVPMLGKSNEHWKTLVLGKGKVIGEFVCDKIEDFHCASVPYVVNNNLGYGEFIDNGVYKVQGNHEGIVFEKNDKYIDTMIKNAELANMCLSAQELFDYIGLGNPLYAWHISDLVIYDKPKELSEFQQCHKCPHTCVSQSKSLCEYHRLKRPPQSWCYVEVQE